jgi:hypothetical protein
LIRCRHPESLPSSEPGRISSSTSSDCNAGTTAEEGTGKPTSGVFGLAVFLGGPAVAFDADAGAEPGTENALAVARRTRSEGAGTSSGPR